jgi:hypothetical protein
MTNGIVRALTCRDPAYKCPSPHEKRPGSGNAHFRKGVRRVWCNAVASHCVAAVVCGDGR